MSRVSFAHENHLASFLSEARAFPMLAAGSALVLGLPDDEGRVVLLAPERDVPIGGRVF